MAKKCVIKAAADFSVWDVATYGGNSVRHKIESGFGPSDK